MLILFSGSQSLFHTKPGRFLSDDWRAETLVIGKPPPPPLTYFYFSTVLLSITRLMG